MKRSRTNDRYPDLIPVHWTGEKGRSSVRAPKGLKTEVDEFLDMLYEETGVRFSRNEFIMTSIKRMLEYLVESKSKKDLLERIDGA